jgi:hypothetical protein
MKNVTAAPNRLPAPVIPSHNKNPKRNLKPDNGTLGIIVAVGFVGVIACINSAVNSVAGNTKPAPAPVAVTRVVPVDTAPANPLKGEVRKGEGQTMGTGDQLVWLCSDPVSDTEWECTNFKGMTASQARKFVDKANNRNNGLAQNEAAREEYGKATYGNCPWTGCRGL